MFPAGVSGLRTRWATLAGGLRLRVVESGPADAPPVVLLHGWGASVYMWRAWFAPLAADGWRAIAVDLPGHGLSDTPASSRAYRLEGQVAMLRELLDAERLSGVNVVAQSMAGTIALELALAGERRLRRLALVNPASLGRVRLQRVARLLSPPLVGAILHRLVARWVVVRAHRLVYGNPSTITARDIDEYWAPSQFLGYAGAMRQMLHEFRWTREPAERLAARLRALHTPVLVVLGTADRLVRDAQPYAAALQALGAPVVVRRVEGGGHAVNEERAREVIELVLGFLRAEGGRES
jgi:pimeloyl-ACP methyl ester carboxylesterase